MSQLLEKKPVSCLEEVEIGHILYSSWGYDQTNIEYFKVIRKTAAMVELQAIGQIYLESESSMSEYVMPAPEVELYEEYWLIPGNEYSEKKVAGKGWFVAPEQGEWHQKPWVWENGMRVEVENAVKYQKPIITKHKPQFMGGQMVVKMASYKYAWSWEGQKNFQSHWA